MKSSRSIESLIAVTVIAVVATWAPAQDRNVPYCTASCCLGPAGAASLVLSGASGRGEPSQRVLLLSAEDTGDQIGCRATGLLRRFRTGGPGRREVGSEGAIHDPRRSRE